MLNPQRERIQDDLRGLLTGEVHCDTAFTQLYATDASIFEIQPLGVLFPQTTMDVVTAVQYARKHGLAIHPRGAGSSCAGGALGAGLVLDFSRGMRRILAQDKEVIKVQSGVQVARLNESLRENGLVFAPDPGNIRATTIGGMVAVDGYGSHWISRGRPSDWLLGLEMVTADGTILSWSREENVADITGVQADSARGRGARSRFHPSRRELSGQDAAAMEKRRILGELKTLLTENEDLLARKRKGSVIDRMGYRTNILVGEKMDMAGLIASSEGTLGVITAVTLQLQKLPENRMTILLLFESLEKATQAVQYLPEFPPNSCDLMDRRHIHFAAERDVRFEVLFPPKTEAALLLDFHHKSRYALYDMLRKVEDVLVHQRELALRMIPAWDEEEAALFWSLANTFQPLPHWTPGVKTPVAVVEDVAVPPARLHEFIVKTQDLLRESKMTGAIYAHAAQGQVRLQPMVDKASPAARHMLLDFARQYYRLVAAMGGTLGAAHGTGLSRAGLLPLWLGEKYEILCRIKDIFDPDGVFQPGKLGTRPEKIPAWSVDGFVSGELLRHSLRKESDADAPAEELALPLVEMGLDWNTEALALVAHKCNGCGDCRAAQRTRMCPMFHSLFCESASPRAKVNLMEGILAGQLELAELGGDTFHHITRQCFQCHSCRLECAANVDVPRLVRRMEEAWARARGLNFYESVLVRMDRWSRKLHYAAPMVNLALGSPWGRWFAEKIFGIARGRKLPRIERRAFLELVRRENRMVEGLEDAETLLPTDDLLSTGADIRGKAVYFVDTYANFFDVSLARATQRVFAHNGIPLVVPEYQKGSGLPAVMLGRSDFAQKSILRNAAILADYVRRGYDIVLTEPAAVLAMKWEFPQIFPENEDVLAVSERVFDACDYLWRCHTQRKLRLPERALPMILGYHAPCRLRALEVGTPDAYLLGLIPGLELRHSATGCCGMGGTFGMLACNYTLSQRMGRKMHTWLRDRELRAGVTSCSACKMQMEHGSTKHTVHPMKLMALVYGQMPELENAMTRFAPELVLT